MYMPSVLQRRPLAAALSPSLRACFGVGCAHHHRCARYEAVAASEASPDTFGTCVSAGRYPLFI
jgi:hypothetical protein